MNPLLGSLIVFFTFQISYSQNKIIIEQSFCDPLKTDPYDLKERIIKKEFKNDTLILVLGKREPCCATFKADYSIENNALKINYKNIGEECFCLCYYELTFKIPELHCIASPIFFNGLEIEQSDIKTSNFEIKTDTLKNGNILWSKFENNELILEIENQDTIKLYRQYYKGKLIQETKLINLKGGL